MERDAAGKCFLAKVPACHYRFTLAQKELSGFRAWLGASFNVEAETTTYLGEIVVIFPPGLIDALTEFHVRAHADQEACVRAMGAAFGVALSAVEPRVMTADPNREHRFED